MKSQPTDSVLFLTLDSCRFDTFRASSVPNLRSVGPLRRAQSPSHFTYGSHSSFWMGFTPGLANSSQPWINPKAGKLFRMNFGGSVGHGADAFSLNGRNIVEGFRALGYTAIGTGAVSWFDTSTPTGSVLAHPFNQFFYSGDTFSLSAQLRWLEHALDRIPTDHPSFVFLNIGETHVPYWHEGAPWDPWPSPCIPFGGKHCSRRESRRRQRACLEWVDAQLSPLLAAFSSSTIIACSDHGDCWGEDGLWEHGVSHPSTLTVPLLLRVKGIPI